MLEEIMIIAMPVVVVLYFILKYMYEKWGDE